MNKLLSAGFRTVLLFGLISVAALSSGCWRGVSRQVLATVLAFDGDVAYQGSEQAPSQPVTLETSPGSGSVLRTSSGGRAELVLVPGALLHIASNSEVRMEELRLTKDGNETEDGMRERAARISLGHGSVSIVFERRDESEMRFAIVTPNATINVDSDCVFHVAVEKGRTRLTCARGKAYAQTGGAETSVVKAGYFGEWPNGTAATAAEDPRAQIDVADAFEAERILRELQREQSKRRPF
jgi:hypothetical protein